MEFATSSWTELISLRPNDRVRLPFRGRRGARGTALTDSQPLRVPDLRRRGLRLPPPVVALVGLRVRSGACGVVAQFALGGARCW